MSGTAKLPCPDGIIDGDADGISGLQRYWNLLSLFVLGSLLAAAFLGVFGGGKARPMTVTAPAATLTVSTPRTLRNGEFFETRIDVTAHSDIADLVVAVPRALWKDMTINTMIPAATEELFKDGDFRFSYGGLKRDEALTIKIDGQINPPLFAGTKGKVALLDGERQISAIPFSIRVLP